MISLVFARVRCPIVVRPDSTPKTVNGTTRPSMRAMMEWTGLTQL